MTKLIESNITDKFQQWIYGVDKFDDGTIIPWCKISDDFVFGQYMEFIVNKTTKVGKWTKSSKFRKQY